MMNNIIKAALFSAVLLFCSCSREGQYAYISTSHLEPALDGLHLLYSYDALHWERVPGVILPASVGNKEPYVDAFTGKTVNGKYMPQSMMRDPSICQGPDGIFRLAWTTAWSGSRGFGYSESKDLVNWTEPKEIVVMDKIPTNNVWAPEIFYDDTRRQFMVVFSSCIDPDSRTAADLQGTNGCHRAYYVTTKDFKTFSETKKFYDPGFNSIDAFVLKNGKNNYVTIIKDNRKPGYSDLFCAFSDDPEGPYAPLADPNAYSDPSIAPGTNPGDSLKLQGHFGPEYCEGPCAVKIGDEWYIYYDVYRQTRYGAVRTKDFRTFENIDNLISFPRGHKHGTIIKVRKPILDNLLKQTASSDL